MLRFATQLTSIKMNLFSCRKYDNFIRSFGYESCEAEHLDVQKFWYGATLVNKRLIRPSHPFYTAIIC